TWRDGEPHQGTAQLVCRSYEHGIAACQPATSVLLRPGLRAGTCPASPGSGWHGMGASAGPYDSLALAEDRRRSATQCPSHLGQFFQCLPLERSFQYCLGRTTLLSYRSAKKFTA